MSVERTYHCLDVERDGPVVTLAMRPLSEFARGHGAVTEIHADLAHALTLLRLDDTVRVVVLTGREGEFLVSAPTERWEAAGELPRERAFEVFASIVRCHQAIVESEKPVVARVGGDAIGFGQSLLFAADLVVAVEDALVCDMHMGVGEVRASDGRSVGPPFALVPGDGGAVFAPLYFSPALAKEYLMLARPFRAQELAARGLINHAVAPDELDAQVDSLVQALLRRPPELLAWTKRLANRHVAAQLQRVLDAGAGYELAGMALRPGAPDGD